MIAAGTAKRAEKALKTVAIMIASALELTTAPGRTWGAIAIASSSPLAAGTIDRAEASTVVRIAAGRSALARSSRKRETTSSE
jgi:hypothetical protein